MLSGQQLQDSWASTTESYLVSKNTPRYSNSEQQSHDALLAEDATISPNIVVENTFRSVLLEAWYARMLGYWDITMASQVK